MKNWKTNLIGTILIIAGIVSVFMNKSNWNDATALIIAGAGFLLSKDHDTK